MTRPAPCIGFRRRHRVDGSPYLTAVVAEDLHIAAGSTLDLRRIANDDLDGPSFALLVVAPVAKWSPSKSERESAASDRLTGSAIRRDPRDVEVAS